MSERTRDGLDAARARGRMGGQKPKLTPRQAKERDQHFCISVSVHIHDLHHLQLVSVEIAVRTLLHCAWVLRMEGQPELKPTSDLVVEA
jgi:hypothetical protein